MKSTGCSKKTRTNLVVNIFGTTKDTMTRFGIYDTETHKVLCRPSTHLNVSSVCRAWGIKAEHEFLPCSAQHVCVHQFACSCNPITNILQVCHLVIVDNIFDKPPQKKTNQGRLCLVIMGVRWSVHLGQSRDLEILHSGQLE